MIDIQIGTIRRTRFLSRQIMLKPDESGRLMDPHIYSWNVHDHYQELAEKFLRNRVKIDFKSFGIDPKERSYDQEDIQDLNDSIHEYCDTHCTGYWSMDKSYHRGRDWSTQGNDYSGEGQGYFYVYFENEEDIEPFLTNCAILIKLSN